jgi:hypothetical protein
VRLPLPLARPKDGYTVRTRYRIVLVVLLLLLRVSVDDVVRLVGAVGDEPLARQAGTDSAPQHEPPRVRSR